MLNQIRREAVSQAPGAAIRRSNEEKYARLNHGCKLRWSGVRATTQHRPYRNCICSSGHPEQLEAAIKARPSSITLDYLDLYGLKPSVERD